jgi:class 3 adenylate cyclase/CHASE2 domain-containing sensor protein
MTRTRSQQLGHLVGIGVVMACVAHFFLIDPNSKLELSSFDFRVRRFSSIPATSPIVHIDVDDNSLDRVGRWPWHRDELAALICVIHELKPGHLLIDFQLSEYEPRRTRDVLFGPDSDIEHDTQTVGVLSEENVIFGDMELANAIRQASNVYLAAFCDLPRAGDGRDLIRRLSALFEKDKRITLPQAIDRLALPDKDEIHRRVLVELLKIRIRDTLLSDFSATEAQLAERLGASVEQVMRDFAGVKRSVAETLALRLFGGAAGARQPELGEVLRRILGERAGIRNEDQQDVKNAYRYLLGLAVAEKSLVPLPPGISPDIPVSTRMTPPHFLLGEAARGIGAVNFVADEDGIVRRVPLLIRVGDKAALHLGFAAACHILDRDPNRLRVQGRTLILPGSPDLRVPLDENGNMLIPWTGDARRENRQGGFEHISAAKLWSIVSARNEMRDNTTAIQYMLADIVALVKGDVKTLTPQGHATTQANDHAYRGRVNDYLAVQRKAHLARLHGKIPEAEMQAMEAQATAMLAQIEQDQILAISSVVESCKELDAATPEELAKDEQLRVDVQTYHRARDVIQKDVKTLQDANQRLSEKIQQVQGELAHLEGMHVVLGFAATAAGDIVSTPINPVTNGPVCHAQVLNGFLKNSFLSIVPRPVDAMICLVLGALVVSMTMTRGPTLAGVTTLAMMAAYGLLNCIVLFRAYSIVAALAAPLVTMFVAWAFVTLFRQLTAERDRRHFAKQLSQYTSPVIAARIAESPDAAATFKKVQTRDVTCFFSDLAGFTTISEREDADIVQYVLNTYLKRMSETIWSKRGLINKFMGDGIMAFFNPSVDPLPEHPMAACETSLLVLEELERLKAEQHEGPAARVFDQLDMRVGLASGFAKNGDLGSELKADYTVIGDVVNLAARLEPANKVFGTRIMISGPTRELVKELFDCRYLAELQVKGKGATVPVFELVARKGRMTPEQREYADRFEAGVAMYKAAKWDECIVHFTRMLTRRFDDPGASRYIDACQELKQFPPDAGWAGALELKEK